MRVLISTGILPGGLVWLILGMMPAPAHATKFAGEFLNIGVGPRALGMGSTFVGIADDVTAGYWNPAGLAFLVRRSAALMHSEQLSGFAYDYAAYANPFGIGRRRTAFGISVIRLGLDGIPITRLPDPAQPIDAVLGDGRRNRPFVDRFVSDAEYAFLLSVARRTSERFAIGGNLKLIRKTVGVADAFGAGLDVGVLVRPLRALSLGAQVMNLTTTVLTWSTGRKEYIYPAVKAGLAYDWNVPQLRGRLLLAADVDLLFEGRNRTASASIGSASGTTHLGLEYRVQRVVALRFGAKASQFTAGAGIRVPKVSLFGGAISPRIDYAFVNDDAFGAIHRIGASVDF